MERAAEDPLVDALREQVDRLVKVIEVQNKALLNLEKRLRTLEQKEEDEKVAAPAEPAQPPVQQVPTPGPDVPDEKEVTEARPEETDQPTEGEEEIKRDADPPPVLDTVAAEAQGIFGSRFTIEPGLGFTRVDRSEIGLRGFLALDAIFLGSISVDEVESDTVTFDVTTRLGITDDAQVNLNIPFVYRSSNFISRGAGGAATSQSEERVTAKDLGDIGFGGNYRVFSETEFLPDVVVNVNARAPTGKSPFGIELETVAGSQGNLIIPKQLPTGNGVWQASGGVSFLKTIDPVVLFTSIDYFHNFQTSFDDVDPAPGNQPGDVKLGDAFQVGSGIAVALNERLSLNLSYTQRFVEKSEIRLDPLEEFQEIIGSGANIGVLNFGVTYGITDNLSIVTNVGVGATDDAADFETRISFPFTF